MESQGYTGNTRSSTNHGTSLKNRRVLKLYSSCTLDEVIHMVTVVVKHIKIICFDNWVISPCWTSSITYGQFLTCVFIWGCSG